MTDERMPPQEAHVEAFLESLADVAVPGDLAGAVAEHVRERPSRRPSPRLPLLAAAAGLLLTVSVAMAMGWRPPFDILPGPQPKTTLPLPSAVASPGIESPSPSEAWEFATIVQQGAEVVADPQTGRVLGATFGFGGFDPVLVRERQVVDGRPWIRIEQGGFGSDARFAWVPETIPSEAPVGYRVPVLEDTSFLPCDTGEPPSIASLSGVTAAQRLACYGADSYTIGPVQALARWDRSANTGTPEWLAGPSSMRLQGPIGPGDLIMPLPVRVDPASGLSLPANAWLMVTLHLDDPAAASCARQTVHEDMPVGEPSDQALWCRQQLVVTGYTEVPEPTAAPPTPFPYQTYLGVPMALPDAPIDGRVGESAAWTGTELVIWGGAHRPEVAVSHDPPADGAALDVATGTWRVMAAAPLSGRSGALSAWTGTEVLFWGGTSTGDERWLADGAAWNPATNTWRMLPDASLKGGFPQVAAWTGKGWFIGSGSGLASYDPVTDRWSRGPDLPVGAEDVVGMAWAGDRLALLTQSLSGADMWTIRPGQATWVPLGQAPVEDVPAHGMAFDGSRLWMIGAAAAQSAQGWRVIASWDPGANTWQLVDSPVDTQGAAAVWNGTHLIVVGEYGAAYDPAAQDWLMLPEGGTDRAREDPSVVWAGDRVIVWGGGSGKNAWTKPDGWQLPWDTMGG